MAFPEMMCKKRSNGLLMYVLHTMQQIRNLAHQAPHFMASNNCNNMRSLHFPLYLYVMQLFFKWPQTAS